MEVTHPRLSAAEFEALQAQHGWSAPFEHLAGEAVVTPPGSGSHGSAHVECAVLLHEWQRAAGGGGLLLIDAFVLVGGDSLAPDLAYWSAERRPTVVPRRIDSAPDLVVEIASASTADNDRGPKRRAYTAAGVREQWLVDPEAREMVLVAADGRGTLLTARERLVSRALPGLDVPVAALLGVL